MAVALLMYGKYSGRCFYRAFNFEASMPAISVFIRLSRRARACILTGGPAADLECMTESEAVAAMPSH
jgi:hypothetical protein